MNLNERNYAGDHVVVGSLEVLGDVKGGSIREIKRNVEQIQKQTEVAFRQQDRKWEELSADGVITPIEKQQLLKEIRSIQQSQSAIVYQARSVGLEASYVVQEFYLPRYNALYTYLYTTLELFNDMESSTELESRETFNTKFSDYYYAESFVLLGLSKGIVDLLNIKVLTSLQDAGTEGEIGIYQGGMYQYINGEWKNVNSENYRGALDTLPATENNSFFLASDDFTVTDILYVNGEPLYVNGDELGITLQYVKGMIYYCQDNVWYVENDKSNYRYVAAFADVLNVTGELPQIFQDALDDLQDQIDDLSDAVDTKANQTSLEDEINARLGGWTIIDGELVQIGPEILDIISRVDTAEGTISSQGTRLDTAEGDISGLETAVAGKISHLPEYMGPWTAWPDATMFGEGDYFLWGGATYGIERVHGRVYRLTSGEWEGLPSSFNFNSAYYMMALEDLLALNDAEPGYFTELFTKNFWANSAKITTLDVKTIYLRNTGNIQSAYLQYEHENIGLKIDNKGNIDANGDTHIKGKVAIGVPLANNPDFNTYECVIGGTTKINGEALLCGDIDNAIFEVHNIMPAGRTISYNAGEVLVEQLEDGTGTYNNQTFTRTYYKETYTPGGTYYVIVDYKPVYNSAGMIIRMDPVYEEKTYPATTTTKLYLYNDETLVETLNFCILEHDLTYTWPMPTESRTFKLKNLPTTCPKESGIVWVDKHGYLRIS